VLARIVVLLLAVLLPLSLVPRTPSADARAKTVTKSFSNPAPILIPDSGVALPYPSSLKVSRFHKGEIKDVNIVLHRLRHTFPADVQVLLVGPSGDDAYIWGDCGGDDPVAQVTLTFDDEATPKDCSPTVTGTYQPDAGLSNAFPAPAPPLSGNDALAVFDGSSPNGEWQLFVYDDSDLDSGLFAGGWTLELTVQVKT
jgi:subtilisin-like proprotein convertase family protein